MPEAAGEKDLVAYSKALEAAGLALSLVKAVPAPFRSLADQLVREITWRPLHPRNG